MVSCGFRRVTKVSNKIGVFKYMDEKFGSTLFGSTRSQIFFKIAFLEILQYQQFLYWAEHTDQMKSFFKFLIRQYKICRGSENHGGRRISLSILFRQIKN